MNIIHRLFNDDNFIDDIARHYWGKNEESRNDVKMILLEVINTNITRKEKVRFVMSVGSLIQIYHGTNSFDLYMMVCEDIL